MQHIYPKQLLTYQLSIGIRSLAGPWMGSSMYATPSGFSHASPQQVISPVSHAGTPGSSQPYTCYVCSATATSRSYRSLLSSCYICSANATITSYRSLLSSCYICSASTTITTYRSILSPCYACIASATIRKNDFADLHADASPQSSAAWGQSQ